MIKYSKKIIILFIAMSTIFISCKKDEPYHHISTIETALINKMNEYRTELTLPKLVTNHIMFREARELSDKLAANEISIHDNVIPVKLQELTSNFGGKENAWLVLESQYEIADSIIAQIKRDSTANEMIKRQFTQAGIGISSNSDGNSTVCLLFMNIP
jgi:hypothetical protein